MHSWVVVPGVVGSFRPKPTVEISATLGVQLAWARLEAPCMRYIDDEVDPRSTIELYEWHCGWPWDPEGEAWSDRPSSPYWNGVVGSAIRLGISPRFVVAWQLDLPNALPGNRWYAAGLAAEEQTGGMELGAMEYSQPSLPKSWRIRAPRPGGLDVRRLLR